jgi:hypothetical protein
MSRKTIYIILGVIVAGAAIYLLNPDQGSGGAAAKKDGVVRRTEAGAVRSTRPVSSGAMRGFDEEDMEADFAAIGEQPTNAFRPLVTPKDARDSRAKAEDNLPMNQLPASFAGGEDGWLFTGIVFENGMPSALFENRTSGEGVYLASGKSWRKLTVGRITPGSVVIAGPNGVSRTLVLMQDPPEEEGGSARALAGSTQIQPLNPMASGQGFPGMGFPSFGAPIQAESDGPPPVDETEQPAETSVNPKSRTEDKRNEIR